MPNLHCPTCGIELMEHDEKNCLTHWVETLFDLNLLGAPILLPRAWMLMRKVWELDVEASICRDEIIVGWDIYHPAINTDGTPYQWTERIEKDITGPTFPLRVCRAAIWLASRKD